MARYGLTHAIFVLAAKQEIVIILYANEGSQTVTAAGIQGCLHCIRRKIRTGNVSHLAGLDQTVECLQGLFNWGAGIFCMGIVEVYVISLQSAKGIVASCRNILAR